MTKPPGALTLDEAVAAYNKGDRVYVIRPKYTVRRKEDTRIHHITRLRHTVYNEYRMLDTQPDEKSETSFNSFIECAGDNGGFAFSNYWMALAYRLRILA